MKYFRLGVEDGDNASITGLTTNLPKPRPLSVCLKIFIFVYVTITLALFVGGMCLLLRKADDDQLFQTIKNESHFLNNSLMEPANSNLLTATERSVTSRNDTYTHLSRWTKSDSTTMTQEPNIHTTTTNTLKTSSEPTEKDFTKQTNTPESQIISPGLGYIPEFINTSIDPCGNFFDFACGSWEKVNPVPTNWYDFPPNLDNRAYTAYKELLESPQDDSDIKAVNQAKQFYQKCMNRSQSLSLTNVINDTRDCVDDVRRTFIWALQHKLIQKEFSSENEYQAMLDEVRRLFTQVKVQIEVKLLNATRKHESAMLKSLDEARLCLGFPDWLMNATTVQMRYEKLTVGEETDYWKYNFLIDDWKYDDIYAISNPVFNDPLCTWESSKNWHPIDGVFAFSEMTSLRVFLPMGTLLPPSFYMNGSLSNSFGNLGYTIGHELGHIIAFDNDFSFDWFDLGDTGACLVNKYTNSTLIDGNQIKLNGNQTMEENFADLIGIQAAFTAYTKAKRSIQVLPQRALQQKYSDDQIFFLAYAQSWCDHSYESDIVSFMKLEDPHTPVIFRIPGTLQNSKEFARTWNCPLGSLMNPVLKCEFR